MIKLYEYIFDVCITVHRNIFL